MFNKKVIDLSHFNIVPKDLTGAKADGVRGVIHKLTDGREMVDNSARDRKPLAEAAGLHWGIYHFLRPGSIKLQAAKFLEKAVSLGVMDDNTLIACDFEVDGITLVEVLSFLQTVESATSRVPILYSGHNLKELGGCHALPPLARYRLWLSEYGPKAVLPAGYDKYWLWQYKENGQVNGIAGAVDLSTFDGDDDQLAAEWSGKV